MKAEFKWKYVSVPEQGGLITTGEISMIFSEQEVKELANLLTPRRTLFDPPEIKNPFAGLRGNSITLLKTLWEERGDVPIKRNDKLVKELQRKLYITDLAQLLRTLEKRGFCKIERDSLKGNNGRIKTFNLKF